LLLEIINLLEFDLEFIFSFKKTQVIIGDNSDSKIAENKSSLIQVYNNNMTLKVTLLNHTKKINHLRLLANGQFLASASDDNSVKIWNTSDWKLNWILNKHTTFVLGLEVLTNETIASAHNDNIRISNFINGSTLKEIDTGSNVYALKLLPIRGLLTSGQRNGSIMIWDYINAKLISVLNGGHSDQVLNLELVTEQILASSARDRLVIIWEFDNKCHYF
jgi:WD40 repeat protein